MGTTKEFLSDTCPKCKFRTLFRLGDEHFLAVPLFIESTPDPRAVQTDIEVYVKVCKHCGYIESYAKKLIDRFEELEEGRGFGKIIRTEAGELLVSIFVDYEVNGRRATDFSVPIDKDKMFSLAIGEEKLSDSDLVREVLGEDYIRAWKQRIGKFPEDFAINLRALIRDWSTQKRD